jgi:hypothetical protein
MHHGLTARVDAVNLEDVLGQVKTNPNDLHGTPP